MPLSLPRLDDRTFDQLVDEARLTLPRLAPGWTDHNYHDPGVTLIDLFSWLIEMDLYRLDRTSPASSRAFLRRVGIEPRLPQVAETVVAFDPGQHAMYLLQSQHPVTNAGASIKFQLSRDLTVLPVHLTTVLCGTHDSFVDYSQQNQANGRRYPPFGPDPQVGQALYLGFDAPLEQAETPPTGKTETQVSLYVWVDSPEKDVPLRRRLIEESNAEQAWVKHCDGRGSSHIQTWHYHYSARTQWEYYDQGGSWKPLLNVIDESRACTLSGEIRFLALREGQHTSGGMPSHPDLYFIRCRLVSGYYECPPEIQQIAINAVTARHAVDQGPEEKTSNGRAGQSFGLQNKPVVSGSTSLIVVEDDNEEAWVEAPNWDRAGPHDRVYVLSPKMGEIIFGNGLHGRVPKADTTIRVSQYEVGGGAGGNIPAGTLTKYANSTTLNVLQPFAATGGVDEESLEDAKGRAIAWLEETRRAVTLKDFEDLSLRTPGVPVARAHALVDYDPSMPCVPALGSITVVVVPSCARSIYEPGPDMLRAIERYLTPRRTLTTEVHVISPSFITVAVQARLHSEPEIDPQKLTEQAYAKLHSLFHPLTGGQDGKGWPIGRDVYRSEIMALLNSVPGVTYVEDVGLQFEAELETYAGIVTFKQIIHPNDVSLQIGAQLFVEPSVVIHRLVENACAELESYIRSRRGWLKHRTPETQREELRLVLQSLPGVLHVDELQFSQESPEGLCENVPVCANSLVISGKHQITVLGAHAKPGTRVTKPPC